MAIFMIGYDLRRGQDYKELHAAIASLGLSWHCLDSTWLVKCDLTANAIRNALKPHIKSDDCLLVMRYGKTLPDVNANAAWYGFTENRSKACNDWLVNNL